MNKNLVSKTNKYLANVGVEYIKLHNLHWNVIGVQFKAVHEYLESLYDSLADVLDEVAELLKMGGEFPLASLKDYLEVAEVKELVSKDYGIKETLEIVLADIKLLKNNAVEIRSMAAEEDYYPLKVMMEDHLANYNKTIWFIESMLK
jgi:starvation-inducible DNA-binding protein